MNIFTGLSAFPLTPLHDDSVDEASFIRMIERLKLAGVDSITALGSTGSYAYLSAEERSRIAHLAVQHAGAIPVFVGVSALRTSEAIAHVAAAEAAGSAGILVAPMSYQPLTENDVYELFRTITEHTELPVIVYDNPGTTHFTFTNELYARIAQLPGIASIKIPAIPADPVAAREHVAGIRSAIPEHVTIGVSGDASAAGGLRAGCDAWYSVIGGTIPDPALTVTHAALNGRIEDAILESDRLAPLWHLFTKFGSLRVVAAIAEYLGLAQHQCLPLPIQGLTATQRTEVTQVVDELGLV